MPMLMPILMLLLIPLHWSAATLSAPVTLAAAARGGTSAWGSPVSPLTVVRPFAVGPYPWSPGHRGVDLTAVPGTAVRSPADGVVSFAGTVAGRGVIVISHHRGGQQLVRSSFEPVRPLLTAGRPVAEGQIIAQVASPGTPAAGTPGGHCLAPVCLHWGVRIGASYVDPMGMLGIRPVVLLPLDAVR